MDAKYIIEAVHNFVNETGGFDYKTLSKKVTGKLPSKDILNKIGDLPIKLEDAIKNEDKIVIKKIMYIMSKILFEMLQYNIKVSYIIGAVWTTLRLACIDIKQDTLCIITCELLNSVYNEIDKLVTSQQPIQQQLVVTDESDQQPVANMQFGFDPTKFISRNPQQNFVNILQPVVNTQQYMNQQQNNENDIMLNNIKNNIITDSCINPNACQLEIANGKKYPDKYEQDLKMLNWLITNQALRFMLTNFGVAPNAKFVNIKNDDQSYKFKFEIGGKYIYLSDKYFIDPNNGAITYQYRIV